MTLRTPRELPETVQSEKVRFVKIRPSHWFSATGSPKKRAFWGAYRGYPRE